MKRISLFVFIFILSVFIIPAAECYAADDDMLSYYSTLLEDYIPRDTDNIQNIDEFSLSYDEDDNMCFTFTFDRYLNASFTDEDKVYILVKAKTSEDTYYLYVTWDMQTIKNESSGKNFFQQIYYAIFPKYTYTVALKNSLVSEKLNTTEYEIEQIILLVTSHEKAVSDDSTSGSHGGGYIDSGYFGYQTFTFNNDMVTSEIFNVAGQSLKKNTVIPLDLNMVTVSNFLKNLIPSFVGLVGALFTIVIEFLSFLPAQVIYILYLCLFMSFAIGIYKLIRG